MKVFVRNTKVPMRSIPSASFTQEMRSQGLLHGIKFDSNTLRWETGKNGQTNLVCSTLGGKSYLWNKLTRSWVYLYG